MKVLGYLLMLILEPERGNRSDFFFLMQCWSAIPRPYLCAGKVKQNKVPAQSRQWEEEVGSKDMLFIQCKSLVFFLPPGWLSANKPDTIIKILGDILIFW